MALVLIGFLMISLSACGNKKVEIDIADQALNLVENAAPSVDYAFFVASDSVPQSANELPQYKLIACTGDGVMNRAIQIGMGLGMSSISSGGSNADCIKQANVADTLLVTQRDNKPSSGMVEIIFK